MTRSGPTSSPVSDSDNLQWRYGIVGVALGLTTILAAVLISLSLDPSGASSVLGIVISPIAAIIGAYFGIQVSSGAAKDAQNRADMAENDKANAKADRATLLGAIDPQAAKDISPRLHFQP